MRNKDRVTYINNKVRARSWRGLLMVAALLATGCEGDGTDGTDTAPTGDTLQMASYGVPFTTVETRADDYSSYATLYPGAVANSTSIGVFMAPHQTGQLGLFEYRGDDRWHSRVSVVSGNDYYIYGFMPTGAVSSGVSLRPRTGSDYKDGAVLTLKGLSPVTATDVAVLIGVKGVSSRTEAATVEKGNFYYKGRPPGENWAYLLFDHLFCAFQFRVKVDATYNALRTIKLRRMELKSVSTGNVDAEITLDPSTSNVIRSITWTHPEGTSAAILYESTDTEQGLTLTTEAQDIWAFYTPAINQSRFELTSTYDVYDKKDNLVRKDCTATNVLKDMPTSNRGERSVYTLTVNPTYLYQLSEPDAEWSLKIEN